MSERCAGRDVRADTTGGVRPGRLVLWAGLTCWATCVASAQQPATTQPAQPKEEVFTFEDVETGLEGTADEGGLWEALTENLRFNLDVVSRVETTHRRGKAAAMNAVGLDILKVFSDESGDIGTLLLQPYAVRRDNALPVPPHTDDDDDWEHEFHDFYFNLTRFGRGRTNLKVGHFDVPFGLEPIVDTHFTVRQLIPVQNLGMKKDWGISLNGVLPQFDYEVSLTQGSGFEYNNRGENYAVAGRIGTPQEENFVVGASAFYGQVIDPHGVHRWQAGVRGPTRIETSLGDDPSAPRGDDQLVRRVRAGLDMTWIIEQFTLRGEAAVGRDYNQDVLNALLELDWTNPDESVTAYVQGIYLGQRNARGWSEDVIAKLGAVWQITREWSLSAEYSQDLTRYLAQPEDAKFVLQMRLRF